MATGAEDLYEGFYEGRREFTPDLAEPYNPYNASVTWCVDVFDRETEEFVRGFDLGQLTEAEARTISNTPAHYEVIGEANVCTPEGEALLLRLCPPIRPYLNDEYHVYLGAASRSLERLKDEGAR